MSAAAPPLPRRALLGHPLYCATRRGAVRRLLAAARARRGGAAYFCNVHMAVEGLRHHDLRQALRRADWVFPDGMPLVAALRLLGERGCERVAGMDLVPELCRAAAGAGLAVWFHGGSPATLAALAARLRDTAPGLRIAGMTSPPFRALSIEEEREHVAAIEASGAHLCFVGLGCPKQEMWIARHRAHTGAVLLGVGAAFNTTAGTMRLAPQWLRDAGLEWLYRLAQEPRRLWRRYLATNPVFINRFLRQLWAQ